VRPDANGEGAPDTSFEPAEFAGEPPAAPPPADEFSRESLRLNQNLTTALGLQKHVHTVTVDKPPPAVWFRVHDGEDMVFDTMLLHVKDGPHRGVYQLPQRLMPLMSGERMFKPTRLVLCVTTQGALYLWPLRLPDASGRTDDWMDSALAICEQARTQWVRRVSGDTGYVSMTTDAKIPDPVWPDKTFDELLEMAFKKKRIKSESDPVLKHLREGT
jgi:hypothetical protein